MYCPHCGARNRDGAAFCLSCRATLPPEPPDWAAPESAGWSTPFFDRDTAAGRSAYAGFWDRFFALILDLCLALSLGAVPGLVLLFVLRGSGLAIAVILLGWLLCIFTYPVIATVYGGGFGMRMIGIRIIRVDNGANPGLKLAVLRVATRNLFAMLPVIGVPLAILDHLWMINDDHKQTWHDKIAGTYVIER